MSESYDTEYKKKWIKLDKHQKINRIMNYINNMVDIISIPEHRLQVQALLVDYIMNKCTKNFNVEYCEETGTIIALPDLKQNAVSKLYYIGIDVTEINSVIKDYTKLDIPQPFKGIPLSSLF